MTESDARDVLLIRAFESVASPAWSADDAAWATAEARRAEGERAPFERILVRRAQIARGQLVRRDAAAGAVLASFGPHGWLGWTVVLGAFALGIASDAIGPSGRINILSPPLLAVLVWNLAVYLALVLQSAGALRLDIAPGPLRKGFLRIARFIGGRIGAGTAAHPSVGRFIADWLSASSAMQGARVAFVLHAGAAALVIGVLVSLYLRGVAFEYRAGWDSTFLTPTAVHQVLGIVLGPASQLSGIPLPDADHLAQLRFSVGPGENAAPWIHLYALTLGLTIVLPRVLLAAFAAWRMRSLDRRFPIALEADYFARLRRALSGEAIAALALPYSYQLTAAATAGLTRALERILGPPVALSLAAPLPQGAEDDLQPWFGPRPAHVVIAVFALTATPERETHGAFVRALAARATPIRLIVLVDESGFRQRFTGADGARRLDERHSAWKRMLGETNVEPVFIDLTSKS